MQGHVAAGLVLFENEPPMPCTRAAPCRVPAHDL